MSRAGGHPRRRGGRLRQIAALLFPAVVAVSLGTPVLVPGALAFTIREDFPLTASEIGLLVAAFYLLATVATRTTVPLVTRFSPMAVVRIGLTLSALSVALGAGLGTKEALVVMTLAGGIANGLATPASNLMIPLTVPAHRHGLAFGLRMGAIPAATGLTAAGAFAVAETGVDWRAICAGLAAVITLVLLSSLAGRSVRLPAGNSTANAQGRANASLTLLAWGGLLAAAACSSLPAFLVDGLIANGAQAGQAALLLTISGWAGVAARIASGLLADHLGRPTRHLGLAATMLLVAATGMVCLAFVHAVGPLFAATLITFSFGWAWPALLLYATVALHPDQMARATTQMQTGTFFGAVVGPLSFGFAVQYGSYALAWSASAVLATLAAVLIVAGARRAPRPAREAPAAGMGGISAGGAVA